MGMILRIRCDNLQSQYTQHPTVASVGPYSLKSKCVSELLLNQNSCLVLLKDLSPPIISYSLRCEYAEFKLTLIRI